VVTLRIGELAARAGVTARALRYYEEQCLLHSERSPSGQRHYSTHAVERVKLIRLLFAANLSSRTIAELLPCERTKITPEVARERLAAERRRINAEIAELATGRAQLDEVIAGLGKPMSGCTYGTPGDETC
jgi:DNA-binding transcriptional MerR regulator